MTSPEFRAFPWPVVTGVETAYLGESWPRVGSAQATGLTLDHLPASRYSVKAVSPLKN
jgi:hypothetical protein